ncbi:MAG TPA: hypothetical protein VFG35_27675 [Actinoplanes sp.]|nr:hypothetical protein [Actinoplanes sp.]
MTTTEHDQAISDPVGLITDLVAAADPGLAPDRIQSAVAAVAAGRAKSRRLAAALATRPAVLLDGRSPAPRVVGELLVAVRVAGATAISAPCCAGCGKQLQAFTRKGQDWYCGSCEHRPRPGSTAPPAATPIIRSPDDVNGAGSTGAWTRSWARPEPTYQPACWPCATTSPPPNTPSPPTDG